MKKIMHGRWVVCPSNPASQRIILKIEGFLFCIALLSFESSDEKLYRTVNFISSNSFENCHLFLKCLTLLFIISFLFLQSKLAHIGESRMEMDYKLVENEGLFQEYLEMGKYFRPVLKNVFTAIIFAKNYSL